MVFLPFSHQTNKTGESREINVKYFSLNLINYLFVKSVILIDNDKNIFILFMYQ